LWGGEKRIEKLYYYTPMGWERRVAADQSTDSRSEGSISAPKIEKEKKGTTFMETAPARGELLHCMHTKMLQPRLVKAPFPGRWGIPRYRPSWSRSEVASHAGPWLTGAKRSHVQTVSMSWMTGERRSIGGDKDWWKTSCGDKRGDICTRDLVTTPGGGIRAQKKRLSTAASR